MCVDAICIHDAVATYLYYICVQVIILFAQSVITGYLAEFFRDKQVLEEDHDYLLSQNDTEGAQAKQEKIDESVRNGYLYALALVPLTFLFAILRANTFFLGNKMGMMCRIITTGAIYQKVSTYVHRCCYESLEIRDKRM